MAKCHDNRKRKKRIVRREALQKRQKALRALTGWDLCPAERGRLFADQAASLNFLWAGRDAKW